MNAPLLLPLVAVYALAVLTAWLVAELVCRRCHRATPAATSPLLRLGDLTRPAGRPTRHRRPGDPPPA